MAAAFDQNLGTAIQNGSGSSIPLTTAQTVAANALIVVFMEVNTSGETITFSGGGLTWTTDATYSDVGDGRTMAIGSAQAPSGLASGTVITASFSSPSTVSKIAAASFTGMATSSIVDVLASSAANPGGAAWVSSTVNTLNATDVVFGFIMCGGVGNPTSTPGGGWTEIHDWNNGLQESLTTVYQIVSSTGSYQPSGTWSSSQTSDSFITIAYKAAAGGDPSYTNPAGLVSGPSF